MHHPKHFLDRRDLLVDPAIFERFWLPRPAKVRILVVVEPRIAAGPPGRGFGLGRVVSYLRDETFGFVDFEVHFAQRGTTDAPNAVSINPAPGPWDFHYTRFRFHSVDAEGRPIIERYDQVWCFGIEPFVHDEGANAEVATSPYSPSNAEVAVISRWMDAGGGVLAMGDHNFLGSAMCWRLPRVGTMRAWLKDADDRKSVPNRTGPDRHDTNRPQNASQDATMTANPAEIPIDAEEDTVTQPLSWKRYTTWSPFVGQVRRRPHPILCGGSLGVIDRFPDHPHEGLVIHESVIDTSAKCAHDASKDEYPTVGGAQPRPEVIAWVGTLGDPPYDHEKGAQPARRFPAIGVYDGHSIEHGRVVVDSTWHHWFDMNIAALEAADTLDFRKIKRYFQNVAIYLARKGQQAQMLRSATFWTLSSASALEELTPDLPIFALGGLAIDILGRKTSDCLVTSWLINRLPLPIERALGEKRPHPSPCWSCPPEDLFPRAVMGGIVRELLPFRDALLAQAWDRDGDRKDGPSVEKVEAAIARGTMAGLETALKVVRDNRESLEAATRALTDGFEHALEQLEKQPVGGKC